MEQLLILMKRLTWLIERGYLEPESLTGLFEGCGVTTDTGLAGVIVGEPPMLKLDDGTLVDLDIEAMWTFTTCGRISQVAEPDETSPAWKAVLDILKQAGFAITVPDATLAGAIAGLIAQRDQYKKIADAKTRHLDTEMGHRERITAALDVINMDTSSIEKIVESVRIVCGSHAGKAVFDGGSPVEPDSESDDLAAVRRKLAEQVTSKRRDPSEP